MRPDNDPAIQRELDALDDALAGRPVDDDLLEWAALAVAVRDERPEPEPAFARELDARVRQGFEDRRPRLGLRLPVLMPIAGLACTVLLLAGVLANLDRGADEESASSGASGGSTAMPYAADSEATGGSGGAESSEEARSANGGLLMERDSGGGAAASAQALTPAAKPPATGRNRKVQRSASLELAAPPAELDEVANRVIGVTDRFRGVVMRSSVTATADGGGGSFTLRFPVTRLDAALAELSRLADVRSRTQASDDITGNYVDAREALEDARTERKRLLERLAEAVTVDETEALRARLRMVSREIATARAQVLRVQRRASFATVDVQLLGDTSAADEDDGAGVWTPADAWGDALRVLQTALGVLLVALAVLIPLALVAVPLLVAVRMSARRRREAALDV